MDGGIHFISGLPRSGSTLLAALLAQNPAIHAGITSPLGGIFAALLREMSQRNETASLLDARRRAAVLGAIAPAYYADIGPGRTVFDTNRMWTARLGALAALHPEARIICCVRHVPWIIDSVERLVRANPLELSGMFGFDAAGTVYSRAEALGGAAGLLGLAWNALREACHGPEAGRMLLLTYETLTTDPLAALRAIYDFTGLPGFAHDPERVGFDAATAAAAREFDARLGMPGLHRLGARVHAEARASLLPPELFARYEGASFWRDPACGLPAGLRIV